MKDRSCLKAALNQYSVPYVDGDMGDLVIELAELLLEAVGEVLCHILFIPCG